jgi:hypothetical protein
MKYLLTLALALLQGTTALVGPSWTYKNSEAPAGEKNMGSFIMAVYTDEQQERLGVDENGNPEVDYHAALLDGFRNRTFVKHGMMKENVTECEEIYIPAKEIVRFSLDHSKREYRKYKSGLCPAPYTTYDKVTKDTKYKDVTHVQRGVGSTAGSVVLTDCDTNSLATMSWQHGTVTKGSAMSLTGSGTASSSLSGGTFAIKAQFGNGPAPVSLIDQSTANCGQISKTLLLGFGTISGKACSYAASESVSVSIPVPNLGGVVIATMNAVDGSGNTIFCVNMQLNL